MPTATGGHLARAAFVFCISLGATAAGAQEQVLDRIDAFNATSVLQMTFDDPDATVDFINLGIVGTNFTACKLTALDGLYCLDGKVIRHWPDTEEPGTFINEFSCADAALGLASTNPCTAMTVGLSGAIYLAGRKTNSNNLIKVTAKPSAGCPAGTTTFAGGRYCAAVLYAGTPQLIDISPVEGDESAEFKACPSCNVQSGILGLGDKKSVVFFPDPKLITSVPFEIASGPALNLSGSEQLQSGAVLQVKNGGTTDSYVVLTTTNGRILAKQTNEAGSVVPVFDIPTERSPSSIQCNSDTQNYGIRTSSKTGRVYATDRNFCEVIALVPNGPLFTALVNDGDTEDLTLSTGTHPPLGPTLAPGISIDLGDCTVNCTYLQDEEGTPAASFVAVKLASGSESNATAFLVEGIPDCRHIPVGSNATCDAAPNRAIVDPTGAGHPAAQLLNVTPLLPLEIRSLFDDSGVPPAGLPPLLISRQFIGQARTNRLFNAFVYLTEPGVRFRDTFIAEFDVPVLEGVNPGETLGCEPDPANLLAQDVMTNVSELYVTTSINGDNLGEYVDMPTNVGCINPTRTQQPRISVVPYNLGFNGDTYGFTIASPNNKVVTEGNDAVFARLVQSLYDDLEFVRRELACKPVDAGSGQAPFTSTVCNTLASKWANGKIKLDKCINAAFQPKQSTADENCKSFLTQLTNFRSAIPATTPTRDIANRTGEEKTRVDVIANIFNTRLLPSMTTAGFCREQTPVPATCPDPWQ
jgi:hypothetical protein